MKPLDIRCNHQERTKAADILGDALSAGQIDLDDFEKRSAACVNATTRAELIEPLADLVEDPEVLLFGQERKIAKPYAGQQESKAIAKVEQAIRQVQPSVQETRSLAVGIFGGSTVSGGAVARSLTALGFSAEWTSISRASPCTVVLPPSTRRAPLVASMFIFPKASASTSAALDSLADMTSR